MLQTIFQNRDYWCYWYQFLFGMIDMCRPWKLSSFQDLSPPSSIYVHNSSTPLTSDVQFQTNSLLQMITNPRMTIIYIIQGWLLYMLSGPSFRTAFVFSINSLILYGFLLTFFHLAEASAFSWLYTLACAVVQKYHEMSFIIIIYIYGTHFESTYFICTTWKRKQTIEQQPHLACERTKSKQKQNQVTSYSIDYAFYCST